MPWPEGGRFPALFRLPHCVFPGAGLLKGGFEGSCDSEEGKGKGQDVPALGHLLLLMTAIQLLSLSHMGFHIGFYLGKWGGGSVHGIEV